MAIKFTEEWYRLHMPPLKAAFEDDTIALLRDSEHQGDLRMVKLVRGIARVPPTREGETGKKRHGDYAIALALAHFASRMQWAEYDYRPVPPRDEALTDTMATHPDDDAPRGWWKPPLGRQLRGRI